MYKAYKFRIYPNIDQRIYFAKNFGCVRFIYNKMLDDKIKYYKENKKMLYNTVIQYKPDFPWLNEVDSQALNYTQRHLEAAFKNFFKNPASKFPKFKSKKYNKSTFTTRSCVNGIRIKDNKIRLPKIGFIKIKLHREISMDWLIKAVTISKTPSDKYYASILFSYDYKIPKINPQKIIGLKFSTKDLFVSSNGISAQIPHFYKDALPKLTREQRKLSHCVKDSKNYNKQRLKLAKLHEKVTNCRKDFLHKITRKIADQYDIVCIEDLNIQSMMKSKKFNQSLADNAWFMFCTFLSYKLAEQGKQLIKSDRCYLPLQSDIKAAINIAKDGKRLLAL